MSGGTHQVKTRRACAADVPQLCGLLAQLFAQEADFTPDPKRQVRGLNLILDQPETGQLHCAASEDMIVGMVSILFSVSTAEGGRVAWLEDMIVHPDKRGQGIGRTLLDAAIRGAREAGCLRLTLLTDTTNAAAMQFYARSGFSRSAMLPMRLKL